MEHISLFKNEKQDLMDFLLTISTLSDINIIKSPVNFIRQFVSRKELRRFTFVENIHGRLMDYLIFLKIIDCVIGRYFRLDPWRKPGCQQFLSDTLLA